MEKVLYVSDNENELVFEDHSRWRNAKWHNRIIGRISPKYKNKFIDVIPFDYKGNGTYELLVKNG